MILVYPESKQKREERDPRIRYRDEGDPYCCLFYCPKKEAGICDPIKCKWIMQEMDELEIEQETPSPVLP